ncbi:Leucine-rich repeat-containing protein 30 [Bagarius yarrelli]|uniref:Leucine-rich repeat-containing protein 30 n=1 Tax=Bagarius yarrelli TaxID=175774 RepID=A0A556TJR7_BAGYA|nr:Leucine-rich repeat-containing protein 30 [Bagarius yarrelli]
MLSAGSEHSPLEGCSSTCQSTVAIWMPRAIAGTNSSCSCNVNSAKPENGYEMIWDPMSRRKKKLWDAANQIHTQKDEENDENEKLQEVVSHKIVKAERSHCASMGGKKSKEATSKDMKFVGRKSAACEETVTSSDRIRKYVVMQFGYNVLSLARQGMIAPPEELWELTELQKLNLSLNCLCFLPSSVASLQNLVVLNLWGNQLTSLPPEIGQLRNLKVLFAYHNHLTDVPEELGFCTKLEVLSLANNQLTSLPDSLSALTSLQKLNLSHNNIVYLPACVYAMKKLVFLHVACNRLENIAEHIQALADLKTLIVEENCIHSLPKMLCCLTKLELLNVDYNDIQNVPAEMHQLSRLQKLAAHPLDKGLHIMHNPLLKPIKEVLDGGLQALYNYLKAN